jgi:hypothetical protein
MKLKKISIGICTVLTFAFTLQSCKKNFEAINTNPNALSTPTVSFLFSKALVDGFNMGSNFTANTGNYYTSEIANCGGFIQHFANYKLTTGVGDKYLINDYANIFMNGYYQSCVNEIGEVITHSTAADDVNNLSMARIWRVYLMHRMTDIFGDVPYSQAATGYSKNNYFPAYDAQSQIYSNMLSELDAATQALDASKSNFGNADLLYQGNITSWKKFAYSLMLRLGMRLTKVDPASAQKWVQKAIAGGVIINDADIAVLKYTDGPQDINRNPAAFDLIVNDYSTIAHGVNLIEGDKYSKTLIDYLTTTNDPRLSVIAVVWNGAVTDTTAANQKGMANGLTSQPANFGSYSEPNPNTILKYTAPMLVLTNAETNFLLAEATIRGWNTGLASAYYNAGVTAAMNHWALYGSGGIISASKANAYLTAHPYVGGSFNAQMQQIHTQFWVSLLYDELECYANWRRTGYPVLTPVTYPGNASGGTIPRRIAYPSIEASINSANYNAAVARQGPDVLTTRVWWDKN